MSEAEDDLERVEEIAAELAAMSEKSRIEFVRRKLVPAVEYILTVTDLDEQIIREVNKDVKHLYIFINNFFPIRCSNVHLFQ